MAGASSSKIVAYGAIVATLATAVSKFVTAFFTSSAASISGGIHSLVDSGNGVLILFGMNRSARPADAKYSELIRILIEASALTHPSAGSTQPAGAVG